MILSPQALWKRRHRDVTPPSVFPGEIAFVFDPAVWVAPYKCAWHLCGLEGTDLAEIPDQIDSRRAADNKRTNKKELHLRTCERCRSVKYCSGALNSIVFPLIVQAFLSGVCCSLLRGLIAGIFFFC